jgi:carboxypeptidase Q
MWRFVILLSCGTALANETPHQRLVGAALANGGAYATAQSLSDRVGARLAGSEGAARAVEWAVKTMKDAGLKNVKKEPVKVPRWVRGEASATVTAPVTQPLSVVALGGSVPTPAEGISAEVVEVESFDALKALGDKAKGKIVLFNKEMKKSSFFDGYGSVVAMRSRGAIDAAKAGAIAHLVRSTGSGHHRQAHTGAMRYDDKITKIPSAAIAAEDAELIHRLIAGGETVKLTLKLTPKLEGEVESFNVVGEVPGEKRPDEIVLIGAHLDSWDLGTGALDDAAGCAMVIDAARSMVQLGLKPMRTVRVVLFMNEEFGLSGARAYADTHKAEVKKHVAAMEADAGAGKPLGFRVVGGVEAKNMVRGLVKPLARWLPVDVSSEEMAGADLIPLQAVGVPVLSLHQDVSEYFEWHHTAGDTFDKIDPQDIALATAALASLTWSLATSNEHLPPSPPPPKW